MKEFIVKCKNEACGILFKTDNKRVGYCSPQCQEENAKRKTQELLLKESQETFKDVPDIPTCKICGFKAINLIQHIAFTHGLRQKTYMRKYKAKIKDIYHHSYLDEVKTRGKGQIVVCKNEGCETEFEKITPNKDYCSSKCQKEHQRKRFKTKEMIPLGTEKICRQCKKPYTPKHKHPHSYFCSAKCRNRFYYEKKKVGKVKLCIGCGKEMDKISYKRYCGKACHDKTKLEKRLPKIIKASIEQYKNVPDIPECKICGFKGKLLHAHIKKYHKMSPEDYCTKYDVSKDSLGYHNVAEKMKKKITFDRKLKEYLASHRVP